MALKIRLRKQGRTNRQTFRLVVTDARTPRDGKYLEKVGWYLPYQLENNIFVNEERINFWLNKGAVLSENAEKLIGKAAPEVIRQLYARQLAKRLKEAANRKASKKREKPAENVAAQEALNDEKVES